MEGRGHAMTATMVSPEVHAFARSVREALDDLPADDIDELTDGLEADLAESIAESQTDTEASGARASDAGQLDDPIAYAAELRTSAGLAPRIRRTRRLTGRSVLAWFTQLRTDFVSGVNSTKAGAVVWAFLVAIRPLWWVARGWAIYQVFASLTLGFRYLEPVPSNPILGLMMVAAIVLSVQWGRGRLLYTSWLSRSKVAVSAIALIALPFLLAAIPTGPDIRYIEAAAEPAVGLSQNGQQVSNIFAYDSAGALLSGVQLFDQNGTPLAIASPDASEVGYVQFFTADGSARYVLPSDSVPGRGGWNVFPLREVAEGDINFDQYPVSVDPKSARQPAAPFTRVQPLAEMTEAQMNPMTPSPSPSPSSSSLPSPSAPVPGAPSISPAPTP